MNETNNSSANGAVLRTDAPIALLEILVSIAKKKKQIIGIPMIVAILSLIVSLFLPNEYLANTKFLPPQQGQSSASALLAQIGGVAGMAVGTAGLKNPNEMYVTMLKSRSVADRLISRFNLKTVYDTNSPEKARKFLGENTEINIGKDGIITIEVVDRNQALVAPIANAYIEELSHLTRTLALTEASQRRLFFERQLETSKNNLADAEINLKSALDSRGMISVDIEGRSMVETAARLRAQISAREIQLNSMRSVITDSHPDVQRIRAELTSLTNELAVLENGKQSTNAEKQPQLKSGGFENIKLLRDVKYYQMLYELLAKQYEAARLDEAKDSPLIQILDSALAPERKNKPKKAIIVIIATLLAFILTTLVVVISDAVRSSPNFRNYSTQLRELQSLLKFRSWMPR